MAVPIDAPMPGDLDLGPGFTLRVTALATTDGSVVPGAKVNNLSILVRDGGESAGGPIAYGEWYLVPGEGA